MIAPSDIQQEALALYQAEKTQIQTGLLTLRHPQMDMDDAYLIQDALVARKIADGRRKIGWKIGLTSKAMQYALNIDIPDSGILLDDMLFDNGAIIPKNHFIQPRVEAEIAFIMKTPLGSATATREDVINATDYIVPSLEILDTRIVRQDSKTGKRRTVLDTISDNAANAGIVLGNEKFDVRSTDLRWVGAIVKKNDVVEETGLGAGVLDDPITSMIWLAHRMHQYGHYIDAGDIILSGSFIRPIEAEAGSSFVGDFGPLGSVSVIFG